MKKVLPILVLLLTIPFLTQGQISGLVSHYTFDSGTAVDVVNGINGTVTGGTSVTGKVGNALSFSGANGKISIPSNNALSLTSKTITFWVKPNVLKYYNAIYEDGSNQYAGINEAGQIRVNWKNSADVGKASNINAGITAGEWQHVAVVYNVSGENVTISTYRNGTFVSSASATDGLRSYPITSLAARNSGSTVLDGTLDEVRIYNRALSAGEVGEIYAITTPATPVEPPPPPSGATPPPPTTEPPPVVEPPPPTSGSVTRVSVSGQTTTFRTIQEAVATAVAGDDIRVGDGIYRESISFKSSGTAGSPIKLRATGSNVVIDGADPLTGWVRCASQAACGNNPNWQNIFVTSIPAGSLALSTSLYENDEFLWWAQDPNPLNPLVFDETDTFRKVPPTSMTITSVTDPSYLTSADSAYYNEAYVMAWRIPNVVQFAKIRSFTPSTDTITYDSIGGSLYTDRDGMYAIINSIPAIDRAGEYAVDEANVKVYVWPRTGTSNISLSKRRFGIDVSGKSHIVIDGFKLKHFYAGLKDFNYGVGVKNGGTSASPVTGIVIRNNEMSHLRSMVGQGAITLNDSNGVLVENNNIHDNQKNGGMLFSGNGVEVINNRVERNTGTAIRFYDVINGKMINNVVSGSLGTHANGLTVYKAQSTTGSVNVLVAGNVVTNTSRPLTYQESKDLYVINNIFDGAPDNTYVIADWGRMTGTVLLANNTVVNSTNHASLLISESSRSTSHYIVKNNIFDGILGAISPLNFSNNIYVGTSWQQGSSWVKGPGDIIEKDTSKVYTSNFKLTSNSVAIDKGVDLTTMALPQYVIDYLKKDKDGSLRPQGSAVDIGAYEYASGTVVPPPPTTIKGDFNNDGVVNSIDFSLMAGAWNTSNATYDLNKDTTVNTLDYSIMAQNWTR